ncbi:MAG TPA: membrane protein insertion efficiency factor YidD [Patescibacteria group bacterium]|nr:membrane protein insertion efficiency factor YidD [Patescibacteria group bacterium]
MTEIIVGGLKLYKKFISPIFVALMGNACRFTPTCSEYTIESLEKFGTIRGLALGLKRVAKCHPWGGSGYDPTPNLTKN